jgi:hypothetical protein
MPPRREPRLAIASASASRGRHDTSDISLLRDQYQAWRISIAEIYCGRRGALPCRMSYRRHRSPTKPYLMGGA